MEADTRHLSAKVSRLKTPVLVVDDDPLMRKSISRMLSAQGYECAAAADAEAARLVIADKHFGLIVTDMNMPGDSGLELMEHVLQTFPDTAVVMVTGRNEIDLAEAVMEAGAFGYVAKPFDPNQLLITVSNALRRQRLEVENRQYREELRAAVEDRNRSLWETVQDLESLHDELRSANAQTVERLTIAAELRDDETSAHIRRMSRYCGLLALKLGMDEVDAGNLRLASAMHDVGKIGLPDHILGKTRELRPEEFDLMKKHTEIGYRILAGTDNELLETAATIALTHHERLDGTGYPHGLAGEKIPLSGRIASIADTFDALTTNRIYRKAFDLLEALGRMHDACGSQFDPVVFDAFLDSIPEMLDIKDQCESVPGLTAGSRTNRSWLQPSKSRWRRQES